MTHAMPLDIPSTTAAKGESKLDDLLRPLAKKLNANHMSALGIANTMLLARTYNRLKFHHQEAWRRKIYRQQFAALLEENGGLTRPRVELKDGYAIDTSMSLPNLDRILKDADEIIEQRSGVRRKASYRSYFQDIWTPDDARLYPAFLDFATSSDVLAPVGDTLQSIPVLSTTAPPGIRFVESNDAFDDEPNRPKDSQCYHIDFYSLPKSQ